MRSRIIAGLGGCEGADTLINFSWLLLSPLITSARVLMVSVSTSAGIPLAKIKSHSTRALFTDLHFVYEVKQARAEQGPSLNKTVPMIIYSYKT